MALTTLRLTVRAGYQLCARTCPSRLVTTRTHCCPRYYYFSQGLFHPTSPVSNIPAQTFFTSSRLAFSSDTKQSKDEPQDEKGLTVFQRFTQVYKEYGKTLIAVHCVTSLLWYGGFYLVAQRSVQKTFASSARMCSYAHMLYICVECLYVYQRYVSVPYAHLWKRTCCLRFTTKAQYQNFTNFFTKGMRLHPVCFTTWRWTYEKF